MIYQGPKVFRGLISDLYCKVSPHLTRPDELHIIAGGIDNIFNEGETVRVVGDSEASGIIDYAFNSWERDEDGITLDDVTDACMDASILGTKIILYDYSCDIMIIRPDILLGYLISQREPVPEQEDYKAYMDLPSFFAEYSVLWNLGDSSINHDLRKYYHEAGIVFNKDVHGKLSYDSPNKAARFREISHQADIAEDEASSALMDHFTRKIELGIYDFECVMSRVCSASIIPPTYSYVRISVPSPVFGNLASNYSAKELMVLTKEKSDEAYRKDCHILELF